MLDFIEKEKQSKSSKVAIFKIGDNFSTRTQEETTLIHHASPQILGSFFTETGGTGTGLNLEEVKLIFPHILNTALTDPNFYKKVENFYLEFEVILDPVQFDLFDGKPLQISLMDDSKKLGQKLDEEGTLNLPVNLLDYISYKFIIAHPRAGKGSSQNVEQFRFLLVNPEEEKIVKQQERNEKKKADKLFDTVSAEEETLKSICTLFKIKGTYYTDLYDKLKEFKDNNTEMFVKVVGNPLLDTHLLIEKALQNDVVIKLSNTYIYKNENIELGKGIESVLEFLETEEGKPIKHKIKTQIE